MNCLIVHAHPNPGSFSHAVAATAIRTLERAGHTVDVIDLYAIDYQPWLTEHEHAHYDNLVNGSDPSGGPPVNGSAPCGGPLIDGSDPSGGPPVNGSAPCGGLDEIVADHMDRVARAQALIFVYPTWWSGLPAILKGWLERTLLPGFAFELTATDLDGSRASPTAAVNVRPRLTNIGHLVGITSYGSGRLEVRLLGDAGRRTISRTVRALCGSGTKTTWLPCYRLDGSDDEQRRRFLNDVADSLAAALPAATGERP